MFEHNQPKIIEYSIKITFSSIYMWFQNVNEKYVLWFWKFGSLALEKFLKYA